MPRDPRFELLGRHQHVMAQGMNRTPIFLDDADRRGFLVRAGAVFAELHVECVAWALMTNHVHLVLRPRVGSLSKAMNRVLAGHAQAFNRHHDRVGRLFRNRFLSRPVSGDDDLAGLIAYVLLNPVEAGLVANVEALKSFPWTSLAETLQPPLGRRPVVEPRVTLALFGTSAERGAKSLLRLLVGRDRERRGGCATPCVSGAVLLTARERRVLRTVGPTRVDARDELLLSELRRRDRCAAEAVRLRGLGWTVRRVVERASEICGAEVERVRAGGRARKEARARALAAHLATAYLGASDVAVGRETGVTGQAVARAKLRGGEAMEVMSLSAELVFARSIGRS